MDAGEFPMARCLLFAAFPRGSSSKLQHCDTIYSGLHVYLGLRVYR
jgi:hypothetical protein